MSHEPDEAAGDRETAAARPSAAGTPVAPEGATPRIRVRSDRVILVGTVVFAVWALVAWFVPALGTGERDWWRWIGVAGAALGVLSYAYLRRGRGNAAGVLTDRS